MPDLTLSGLTTFLFLVLGIAEIAFTANGLSTASGFVGKSTSNLRGDLHGHDLNLLPEYYEKKPSLVFLATGILTAVTGLFGFLGVFFRATGRSTPAARSIARVNVFLGSLSVVVTLYALIYGMVAQSLSSAWHYSGINSADGKYTVEGWACQMKDVMIDHEDEFGTVCGTLKMARVLTVPLFINSISNGIDVFLVEKVRWDNIQGSVQRDQVNRLPFTRN